MYSVSDEYISLIMGQNTNLNIGWTCYITTTNLDVFLVYASDLKQGASTLTRQCCTGNSLEIGTTCSSELKLGIFLTEENGEYYLDDQVVDRYAFYGATIEVTFTLSWIDENDFMQSENVPCGYYTVTEATRSANVLNITAYDNMIKFQEPLSDPVDKLPFDWLAAACNACDVEIGNTLAEIEAMPNGTVITGGYEVSTKVSTWRDLVGHIASMLAGYATIGRDGKLYIQNYGMTSIRTVSPSWRYTSEVADYETYYSSLVFTNERRNEVMEASTVGNGLTYNLANNPLIQYPNKYIIQRRLDELIVALSSINYTPFEIKTPMDPALDIGDVLTITGKQAGTGSVAAITSIVMPLNGQMQIKCVGQNPKLAEEKTNTQKQLDELSNETYSGLARYDHYTNEDAITIQSGEQHRIAILTFEAAQSSHVDFHCEVTYSLALDEPITEGEAEAVLTVTYYKNGSVVTDYYPMERNTIDGYHILSLMYYWVQGASNQKGSFVAWLGVTGGTITIAAKNARSYISSQGWDAENTDEYDDDVYVVGIEVTTPPTKVSYVSGESLDYTGAVITAFLSDDTQENVTSECIFAPEEGTAVTSDMTEITVKYFRDSEYYYAFIPITVNSVLGIEVTTPPARTSYLANDILDYTGVVVTATMGDNTTIDVTDDCVYLPADGSTAIAGTSEVEVKYIDGQTEHATSFRISVIDYDLLRYVVYTVDETNRIITITDLNYDNIMTDQLDSLVIPDEYNGYSIYIS